MSWKQGGVVPLDDLFSIICFKYCIVSNDDFLTKSLVIPFPSISKSFLKVSAEARNPVVLIYAWANAGSNEGCG